MNSLAITSLMRGDSTAFEEDLDRGIGEADIELFMDQLIRNAVIVVVYFDMIVDIDPGALPVGKDVGINGKGFEERFFQSFE
jgi:hypothetical protein